MSIVPKVVMDQWEVSVGFVAPGGPEFLLVLLVLLMLFGAKDAPRILRKISDLVTQFRHTANTFKHDIMYSDMRAEADARGAEVEEDLGPFDEPEEGFASDSDLHVEEDEEQPKADGESDVESN